MSNVSDKRVILITGGNGFIGSNVAKRLHDQGHYVRIIDLWDDQTFRVYKNTSEFCSEFIEGDIRSLETCRKLFIKNDVKWVFHFAVIKGGFGVINSKDDFVIYQENHLMSLNILQASIDSNVDKFFYASSACVYPCNKHNENLKLKESDTWNCVERDSKPQDFCGVEKLNIEIFISSLIGSPTSLQSNKTTRKFPQFKIARLHNIYGEGGIWYGGREKVPADLLRNVICSNKYTRENTIEIWGNGKQERSFLYIEDCVEVIIKFMEGDLDLTLNIGSEESIGIEELAYIAFGTIGVSHEKVTLKRVQDKNPSDANNKSFDNTLIKKYLNWSPKYSIQEGMKKTSLWIQQELENQHHQYKDNSIGWNELVNSYLESKMNVLTYHNEIITFGVLLPITSQGSTKPEDCLENLTTFLKSLADTSQQDIQDRIGETKYKIKIFIGIDRNDFLFRLIKNNSVGKIFYKYGLTDIDITEFDLLPYSTCDIWGELARKAYKNNCDYFVLFGNDRNDIIIETDGWMNKFHEAYCKISIQNKVPCKFGCVTFTDISFPGFPKFPVIGRVHLDIFNGDIFPQQKFQIQDVYCYLFQIYRRWGCSIILQDVKIQNFVSKITHEQIYEKWHHSDWKFDILDNSVDRVEKWLKKNCKTPIQKLLTLDIVVPSYRVNFKYLYPIINLEIPLTMSTIIFIIIDDPNSSNNIILKRLYEKDPFIRVKVNKTNLGVSFSRNRGLYESNADYILFLDDDVTPEKNILIECEKVIKEHPTACGFIGSSKFPPANKNIFKSAIILSGVTFFWEIAEIWDGDIPWGIAGNLLIRRYKDNILFDPNFPKTGGGEDIDFCLKKREYFIKNVENGKGFQGAPNIKVTHHWWNDGERYYWRFYKWAKGDGALIKMHPNLAYNDIVPNSAELLLGTALIFFATMIFFLLNAIFYDIKIINIFTILTFLSIPLVIISNIIYDIHLHVFIQPFKRVPTIGGYLYILAIIESSFIRIMNEFGRLMGHIERKEWNCIGKRFDWFAKKNGGTMKDEINTNSRKFFIWISLMVFSFSLVIINDLSLIRKDEIFL